MENKKELKVTISTADLVGVPLSHGMYVEETDPGYFDLKDASGTTVCMDGETCYVLEKDGASVLLANRDGEKETKFTLSLEDYEKMATECPSDR